VCLGGPRASPGGVRATPKSRLHTHTPARPGNEVLRTGRLVWGRGTECCSSGPQARKAALISPLILSGQYDPPGLPWRNQTLRPLPNGCHIRRWSAGAGPPNSAFRRLRIRGRAISFDGDVYPEKPDAPRPSATTAADPAERAEINRSSSRTGGPGLPGPRSIRLPFQRVMRPHDGRRR